MSIFRRLQRLRIGQRRNDKNSYALDEPLPSLLTNDTAIKGNRENTAPPVSANGFPYQGSQNDFASLWRSLSPREKDVTALTCLWYTNRQIASKLHVSPDTVKGYVRQVLVKFRVHSKDELKMLLRDWDFSQWGPKALY